MNYIQLSINMPPNVLGLGEVGELEVQMLNLALLPPFCQTPVSCCPFCQSLRVSQYQCEDAIRLLLNFELSS